MAIGAGLFGSLSGVPQQALSAGIIGATGAVGFGAAAWATEKFEELDFLPDLAKKFAFVVPLAGAIASAMVLRRVDSRVAMGVSGGMAMFGIVKALDSFEVTQELVAKLPVKLPGLSGFSGVPDFRLRRYLRGAPVSVESLRGAPVSVDQLSRAPVSIESFNGGANSNSVYQN